MISKSLKNFLSFSFSIQRQIFQIRIQNIPKNSEESDLIEIFKTHGKIRGLKIFRGQEHFMDSALLNLENQEDFHKILNQKEFMFKEQKLNVREYYKNTKIEQNEQDMFQIKISNVPKDTNESELKEYFQNHGAIFKCLIFKNINSDRNHTALITIQNEIDFENIQKQKEFMFQNQKLTVRKYYNKEQYEQMRKKDVNNGIYVKNIHHLLKQEQLMQQFQQFGTIQSIKLFKLNNDIQKDIQLKNRGDAIIYFDNQESVQKALHLNGTLLNNRPLIIEYLK